MDLPRKIGHIVFEINHLPRLKNNVKRGDIEKREEFIIMCKPSSMIDRCAASLVLGLVRVQKSIYSYSTNPTCGYRNTVDFHSQRLPIIKFSRLELDKPRPGKTHKTMFYNILRPTISVKDLKNKGKHKPAILKSSVFHFICTSACSLYLPRPSIFL